VAGTRNLVDREPRQRLVALLDMPSEAQALPRRQVAWQLTAREFPHLAWGVSTDEVLPPRAAALATPEELARFALTGFPGMRERQLAETGVDVLVTGGRFGAGSLREQAVLALMGAGIGYVLVVGGPAERGFRENCLMCGGPVILELPGELEAVEGALAAIRGGGPVSENWPDRLRPQIRESGGLFGYVERLKSGATQMSPPEAVPPLVEHVPRAGVERLLARRTGLPLHRGHVGFVPVDLRYSRDVMSRLLESSLERGAGNGWPTALADAQSIMLFEDHVGFADSADCCAGLEHQRALARRAGLTLHMNQSSLGCDGICHNVIVEESLVTPGQICVGTGSHACTVGVLGALAFGIGTTSMAAAFISGEVLVEVPPTVRVELEGQLAPGVSAKDVMLYLLGLEDVDHGCCVGHMLEFAGPAIARWSLDQQLVLTNMSVEAGAFSGIIGAPTPAVCRHLQQTRGMTAAEVVAAWPVTAGKASCEVVIELDLSRVQPMVALPPRPSNVAPVGEHAGKTITSGFIGGCTGGNLSDLRAAAGELTGDGLQVPLVVQPATLRTMEAAGHEGLLNTFREAGALVLAPGCGACRGMGPGGWEYPCDVVVSASGRNYPGRMGRARGAAPGAAGGARPGAGGDGRGDAAGDGCGEVLLASPATVAASCLAGVLTVPRGL
jgi:3-isopropylmalate/(R)-2-methylmalate dehydratase large subunit